MSERFHVYMGGPIDSWHGAHRIRIDISDWPYVKPLDTLTYKDPDLEDESTEQLRELQGAVLAMVDHGLQMPLRFAHVMVSSVPDPDSCEMRLLYMLKEENNGTTWVASPFPLPWYECDVWSKPRVGRLT